MTYHSNSMFVLRQIEYPRKYLFGYNDYSFTVTDEKKDALKVKKHRDILAFWRTLKFKKLFYITTI